MSTPEHHAHEIMVRAKKFLAGVPRLCFIVVCTINFMASSFGWIAAIMRYMSGNLEGDVTWYCLFILWPVLSILLLLYAINRLNRVDFFRLIIFPAALAFHLASASGTAGELLLYILIAFPLTVILWNVLLSCLLRYSRRSPD